MIKLKNFSVESNSSESTNFSLRNNSFFLKNKAFILVVGMLVILSMIAIYAGYFLKSDPQEIAQKHFDKHYSELLISNNYSNNLKEAVLLFNEKKYSEAISVIEGSSIVNDEPNDVYLILGLSYFGLSDYEAALRHFSKLTQLSSDLNQGVFLQAMTLMRRNELQDNEDAKFFLQQVIKEKAFGTDFAEEWLNKF
jgi:tetratricopeptide (TPR) repeat protein